MTEPRLHLMLASLACLAALVLARAPLTAPAGSMETQRLLAAVRNAGTAFGWRQSRHAALVLGGLLLLVASPALIPGLLTPSHLGWLSLGLFGGVVVVSLVGKLGFYVGLKACAGTSEAAQRQTPAGLSVAIRGGGVIALFVEIVTQLLAGLTLVPLLSAGENELAELTQRSRLILAGLALGAVGAALVGQLSSAALSAAGERGRTDPRLNPGGFSFHIDPKNPTMVLNVAAPSAGTVVARAQDFTALSILSHAVTLSLLLSAIGTSSLLPMAMLYLPLLIRLCGALATALMIAATQVDEAGDPNALLWYGQLGVTLISATAVVGSARWLFGAEHWAPVMIAALIGVGAQCLYSTLARRRGLRSAPSLRRLRDYSRDPGTSYFGEGIAGSVLNTGLDLITLSAVVGASWYIGQNSGWPGGVPTALSMTLAGCLAAAPFACALTLYGPTVETACRVASIVPGRRDVDIRPWLVNVDFSAVGGAALGQLPLIAATAITGLVGTLLIGHGANAMTADNYPLLAPGALLGACSVLVYAALAIRHVGSAASSAGAELDRQLESLSPTQAPSTGLSAGSEVFPDDFSPRYKDHLRFANNVAFSGQGWPAMAWLALPFLAPTALYLLVSSPSAVPMPLAVFAGFATVSGTALALFAESSWLSFSAARRLERMTLNSSPGHWASAIAQTLGATASPASQLALKQVVAAGLVFAAMLHFAAS